MLIASLLASAAMVAAGGDPDGVITTAPLNAPTLAQAMTAAPQTSVTAPTAQDAAPHGLTTEQQIQNWISARTPGVSFDEGAVAGPPAERKTYSMVEVGIGTGGYRSYGAAVSLPVGENGRLNLAYREGRNEPWGYGYSGHGLRGPGSYSPYGGWRGHSYGADTTTQSLSMGFTWNKNGDANQRNPYRRGSYGYD